MILPLLDKTDDFKFEKFRIDMDSAMCPTDSERIFIFLVCLGTTLQRPVRGDVAEEDNDPDRAAQFCVICEAIRRAFMMLIHPYGEDSTTESIQSTHRAFIYSKPNDFNFALCSISMDMFNDKKSCIAMSLHKPVTRSTTLAIHMCLSEHDLQ
jgi:hypothetical protein